MNTNTQRQQKREFKDVMEAWKILQPHFKQRAGMIFRKSRTHALTGEEFEALQYLVHGRGFKYSHD